MTMMEKVVLQRLLIGGFRIMRKQKSTRLHELKARSYLLGTSSHKPVDHQASLNPPVHVSSTFRRWKIRCMFLTSDQLSRLTRRPKVDPVAKLQATKAWSAKIIPTYSKVRIQNVKIQSKKTQNAGIPE